MIRKERRNELRYPVQQPAFVKLQGGNGREVKTVTLNVSTRGLQLRCYEPVALNSKVTVTVRLPNGLPLVGVGEVLRVERQPTAGAFLIAVRCDAPLEISR